MALKTEGGGPSQQLPKSIRQNDDFDLLLTHQRMRKIDVALHAKFIARVNANAAVLFNDFDGLDDFEVAAAATQPANPTLIEQLQERVGGNVRDGNLRLIKVY